MRRRQGESMVAQGVQKDSKDADLSNKGESYAGCSRRQSFDPQP